MKKYAYWIPTGLLCLMMMGSAVMYMLNQDFVAGEYQSMGFPVWVMYFNALCKVLGGIAILAPLNRSFKEFAYAGYLYILVLADGKFGGAAVALVLWSLSYWQYRKQYG